MKKSLYRWIPWGLSVLAYVICFFHSLSMGVIRESLISEFSLSESAFSQISTAYFYVYLMMQIPSGILVDIIGPRTTVAAGTMLSVVGSLLFANATGFGALFLGRLVIGLGVSVIFISIIKLQAIWFEPDKFGRMSGLTCFIGTMGGVLAQTPLAVLIAKVSWRGAFNIVALCSGIISVLVYFYAKDGEKNANYNIEKISIGESMKEIFANKQTWPPFLLYAGFYGTFVVISGIWGTSFMSEVYGISVIEGSKYISMIVLGSAFGAILIGWISDRMKRRKLPILIYALAYIGLWGVLVFYGNGKPPLGCMLLLLFTLGFFSQGFVLSWAIGKEVNNPRNVGMTASVINVGGYIGSIVVPFFMGVALDTYKSMGNSQLMYQKTFFIILIITLITLVFSLLVKETNCRSLYHS